MTVSVNLTQQRMADGTTKAKLVSPFDPKIPGIARRLGGRWSDTAKAWYFDPRDTEAIAAEVQKVFGINPLAPDDVKMVDVRITVAGDPYTDEYRAFGRMILRRAGRDREVYTGDGVVIVEGDFSPRGGSSKSPSINSPRSDRAVIEIRDVPVSLLTDTILWGNGVAIVEVVTR